MPLNRPTLLLGHGPRGVQRARRWVVDTCLEIGRPDLAECAELGVSELVTNALLHGTPPIHVRVRGTRERPRVEVRDGSTDRLHLPATPDTDDLLLTFGRGLSIVARSSEAWGADIEGDGKTVWFIPATGFAEDHGVAGSITGLDLPAAPITDDPIEIVALGVPLTTFLAFNGHYRELRREIRLLELAQDANYPLAKDLSDMFGSFERQLRDEIGAEQIGSAMAAGRATADLRIMAPREAALAMDRFTELLDLSDAFCREELLLSLARTSEQRLFQNWFLGEFVRQANGERPIAWADATAGHNHDGTT